MDYYDKILMIAARDCIGNATAIRNMLEALNFHVELVAINEQKEFDAAFGGNFLCADHLIIQCHGVKEGLCFPLICQTTSGVWFERKHYLRSDDVKQLRKKKTEGAILALACLSASQQLADIFRESGFNYYIGHSGYNQIDSMIFYCATFYCALRSMSRDEETKNYTIQEAHDQATRVQEFPNATKGYRLLNIQQGNAPDALTRAGDL
jgi:hypothetical protein